MAVPPVKVSMSPITYPVPATLIEGTLNALVENVPVPLKVCWLLDILPVEVLKLREAAPTKAPLLVKSPLIFRAVFTASEPMNLKSEPELIVKLVALKLPNVLILMLPTFTNLLPTEPPLIITFPKLWELVIFTWKAPALDEVCVLIPSPKTKVFPVHRFELVAKEVNDKPIPSDRFGSTIVIVPPFTMPPKVASTANVFKLGAKDVRTEPELGSIFILPALILKVPPAIV